eukprot:Clim_evm28s157 gene=Clim_evmTU28s157
MSSDKASANDVQGGADAILSTLTRVLDGPARRSIYRGANGSDTSLATSNVSISASANTLIRKRSQLRLEPQPAGTPDTYHVRDKGKENFEEIAIEHQQQGQEKYRADHRSSMSSTDHGIDGRSEGSTDGKKDLDSRSTVPNGGAPTPQTPTFDSPQLGRACSRLSVGSNHSSTAPATATKPRHAHNRSIQSGLNLVHVRKPSHSAEIMSLVSTNTRTSASSADVALVGSDDSGLAPDASKRTRQSYSNTQEPSPLARELMNSQSMTAVGSTQSLRQRADEFNSTDTHQDLDEVALPTDKHDHEVPRGAHRPISARRRADPSGGAAPGSLESNFEVSIALTGGSKAAMGISLRAARPGICMLPCPYISHVEPGSLAALTGSIHIGDQLSKINGHSTVGLSLQDVMHLFVVERKKSHRMQLGIAASESRARQVVIYRENPNMKLGLRVETGIVARVDPGGVAERAGMRIGERIISVNGESVIDLNDDQLKVRFFRQEDAAKPLKLVTLPIHLFEDMVLTLADAEKASKHRKRSGMVDKETIFL